MPLLRYLLVFLLCLAPFGRSAFAQSAVGITGTNIVDIDGSPLVRGKLCFGTTCIRVNAGNAAGFATQGTAALQVLNAGGTSVLLVPNFTIANSTFAFDGLAFRLGATQTASGQSSPLIPCASGATYTKLYDNSKWTCRANAWVQDSALKVAASGQYGGPGVPTFFCTAPCTWTQSDAATPSASSWAIVATFGAISNNWVLQSGSGSSSGGGIVIEHVFAAAGTYNYTHNLGTAYPLVQCYAISGSSAYTVALVDTSHTAISVGAASDLMCAFLAAGAIAPLVPDFSFTMTPTATTVNPTLAPTQTIGFALAQSPLNGYTATTTYTLTGAASGLTAQTQTISGGTGSATLPVTFPWNQPSGLNAFTVSAAGGTQTHTQAGSITLSTINNGLVEGWQLGEGSGLTFADAQGIASITASNGAMTQGAVSGLSGTAPLFNGSGYADAANSTATTFGTAQPFSVSFWATFTGSAQYDIVLSSMTARTSGWYVLQTGSQLIWTIQGGGSTISLSAPIATIGSVHHYVVTYDGSGSGSGLATYVDGVSVASGGGGSLAGSIASSTPVRVGADYSGGSPHTGAVSRTRIYNRVLTGTEITTLFSGKL